MTETPQNAKNTAAQKGQDVSKMSFEDALAELETTVRELESGKVKLEEAVSAYERGSALKAHCEAKLRDAQLKIDRITLNQDGSATLSPAPISNPAGN